MLDVFNTCSCSVALTNSSRLSPLQTTAPPTPCCDNHLASQLYLPLLRKLQIQSDVNKGPPPKKKYPSIYFYFYQVVSLLQFLRLATITNFSSLTCLLTNPSERMLPQNTQQHKRSSVGLQLLPVLTSLIIRTTSVNKQLVDVNHLVDTSHCTDSSLSISLMPMNSCTVSMQQSI
jgi:hypothetical protein